MTEQTGLESKYNVLDKQFEELEEKFKTLSKESGERQAELNAIIEQFTKYKTEIQTADIKISEILQMYFTLLPRQLPPYERAVYVKLVEVWEILKSMRYE